VAFSAAPFQDLGAKVITDRSTSASTLWHKSFWVHRGVQWRCSVRSDKSRQACKVSGQENNQQYQDAIRSALQRDGFCHSGLATLRCTALIIYRYQERC